jgi:hypothetical protein
VEIRCCAVSRAGNRDEGAARKPVAADAGLGWDRHVSCGEADNRALDIVEQFPGSANGNGSQTADLSCALALPGLKTVDEPSDPQGVLQFAARGVRNAPVRAGVANLAVGTALSYRKRKFAPLRQHEIAEVLPASVLLL